MFDDGVSNICRAGPSFMQRSFVKTATGRASDGTRRRTDVAVRYDCCRASRNDETEKTDREDLSLMS